MLKSIDLGEHIADHRSCSNCDYDLHGLPFGSRCPECGAGIRRRGAKMHVNDTLTDAPIGYLRTLGIASFVMVGTAAAAPVLFVLAQSTHSTLFVVLTLVACGGWLGAVMVATEPRPFKPGMSTNPKRELVAVRLLARLTQGSWLLVALCALLSAATPGSATQMAVAALVLTLVGVAGFLPLAMWLAHLAEWASHTALGARFRIGSFVVVSCGALTAASFVLGVSTGVSGSVLILVGLITLVAACIGLIVILVSLAQLALMMSWAINRARYAIDRDERLAESTEAPPSGAVARVADDLGIEFDDQKSDPEHPKFHGYRMEREGEPDPYDVAPD